MAERVHAVPTGHRRARFDGVRFDLEVWLDEHPVSECAERGCPVDNPSSGRPD